MEMIRCARANARAFDLYLGVLRAHFSLVVTFLQHKTKTQREKNTNIKMQRTATDHTRCIVCNSISMETIGDANHFEHFIIVSFA